MVDPDTVREHADHLGLAVGEAAAGELAEQFSGFDAALDALSELEAPAPPERDHWNPDPEADPLAAYLTRCAVGGGSGPLEGMDVAVKDNVAVAGVPMTCGSPLLEGFVPARDATVVERLLDAGAEITGKANMDEFAFGGDESTMRFRLARNPHDPERQPGSSSAGSAVAVAEGSADAAIGSDTGGSVRFPAAWCGVVGVKPTRGLVSQDGFVQFARTLDTVGVLAPDAATAADVLAAVAGPDSRDERTRGAQVGEYDAAVADADAGDLTVGVVDDLMGNAPELDAVVEDALADLEAAGAEVHSVSIPGYDLWLPAWVGIGMAEVGAYLDDRGLLVPSLDPGDPEFAAALGEALRERPGALGEPLVSGLVYARHLFVDRDGSDYALAHEARRRLRDGVDEALADVDVLASTTVPMLPPEWGTGIDDVFGALANTGPFNVTGHPAVTTPAGTVSDLPVGLQFVARPFEETSALAAAAAAESLRDGNI